MNIRIWIGNTETCMNSKIAAVVQGEETCIVGVALDIFVALLAEEGDAHLAPVDGEAATALLVLVAGDVDAVDAFGGVAHALAPEAVAEPFAYTQAGLAAEGILHLEAETVAEVALPMALEVAAVEMLIGAVALGGESDEVAAIGARRVGTDARGESVGLKGADDGAAQRVEGDACALALAVLPCAHVQGRYVGRDFHFEAFAVGKGGHHLIALVLHVMAREVVGQLVGEVEDAGVFGLDGV